MLERLPACRVVLADKGYDSDAIRRLIEAAGAAPNFPPKINRRWKPCFLPALYRGRNPIERMFGRLKDFRRIATRYDRLATNYLAAVSLAAIIRCWLYVQTVMCLCQVRDAADLPTRPDFLHELKRGRLGVTLQKFRHRQGISHAGVKLVRA